MSDPVKVDYVDDWLTRIRSRIYTQFRDSASWDAFAQLIARQAQDLEDAFQTLFILFDIDNAAGSVLNVIGRVIGQPRLGVDDETYRTYLRARALANKSTGTPEDLYKVFRALITVNALGQSLTGTQFLLVTTSNIGVKAFVLRINVPVTRAQALIATYFLGVAKEAGARGLVEWREQLLGATFTYDGTAAQAYDNGKYAGAKQA